MLQSISKRSDQITSNFGKELASELHIGVEGSAVEQEP